VPELSRLIAENNFGDTRSGGLAGPMGLFIIVLLEIATVLLIRNMNMRIRRLPDRFPDPDGPTSDGPTSDGPTSDDGGATRSADEPPTGPNSTGDG
jgi:hypothetical protein